MWKSISHDFYNIFLYWNYYNALIEFLHINYFLIEKHIKISEDDLAGVPEKPRFLGRGGTAARGQGAVLWTAPTSSASDDEVAGRLAPGGPITMPC